MPDRLRHFACDFRATPRPWIIVSAPSPLAPVDAVPALDRVHDHVLRLVGDQRVAGQVVADVAIRAAARAGELGEAPTFDRLVELAHTRMAVIDRQPPADDVVTRLAGDREPGGAALVRACAVPSRHGAALLDLTVRHGMELRDAASSVGVERGAATARTEALRQVRSQLAAGGLTLDVESTLARLPLVAAPAPIHQLADLSDTGATARRLPPSLAWLGSVAAVTLTVAAVAVGLPQLVAADPAQGAPVAVAEAVSDAPATPQVATSAGGGPEGRVQQLVDREASPEHEASSAEPEAASPAPEPSAEPAPEQAEAPGPDDGPDDEEPGDAERSPEPSPGPGTGPIDLPLPTNP